MEDVREATMLVAVIDEDDDKIEINTAERINGSMIPIATIEIGYNEPMESLQRRYADQIVQRWNSFGQMREALAGLIGMAMEAQSGFASLSPQDLIWRGELTRKISAARAALAASEPLT